MMKKIIIILLLEYSIAFGQGISIGYDLLGKHKATNIKFDDYYLDDLISDVNVGISFRLTTVPDLTKTTNFGAGIEYHSDRSSYDFDGNFSFSSFWFTVYQTLDQHLYGFAQLGYGTFNADETYQGEDAAVLIGGMYHGIGLGYELSYKLNIEGVYCTNKGRYHNHNNIIGLGTSTYDVRYERLNISFLAKF
tara:strand:+ start:268 stop:843 length:576 start_codon:yes stop_codon:yes gene_type:complete